jgi:hypothetical protein
LLGFLFLTGVCFAVIVHETVRYDRPVRSIRGRVTGYGQVVPGFWVDVYDRAKMPLDSMPDFEKRKEEAKVASLEPNEKGEYNIKHLAEGLYEVEFGNHGGGGYNTLSVLIAVDFRGTDDKLCVDLSLESGPGQNTAKKCGTQ